MTAGPVAGGLASSEQSRELTDQWRALRRAATAVALLSSPALFLWLHKHEGWSIGWSLLATALAVFAFRGGLDLLFRRFIQWPSLFGIDSPEVREEDVVARRRIWFWRFWYRIAWAMVLVILGIYVVRVLKDGFDDASLLGTAGDVYHGILNGLQAIPGFVPIGLYFFVFFIFNFLILMGPLMLMGITQIRGFEPGDADWGVRLDDVRGQAEAKEEVRRVVSLWQSGEAFEQAGGKRERGLLFLGAPGTGKTMLAKAIATGFNSPIVTIPGSGFAQTFMGMDAVIVRWMAHKAKKLARKWGGQCIVFIDEIDAVGMRRNSLVGGTSSQPVSSNIHDHLFYGPSGALTASGDVVLKSSAWRERMFAERAGTPAEGGAQAFLSTIGRRLGKTVGLVGGMGMMGGGSGALNQLLVLMDGIDEPPMMRRMLTNRTNAILDALYIVPRRIGKVSLRLSRARVQANNIYFIGACNVSLDVLDPALTRPGRLGRHIRFRTPIKHDRLDIFDHYLAKVVHDPSLDTAKARDELARITNGYSPAMIEQVCSMALTYAHHEERTQFTRDDIVEAMTTIESGSAINIDYVDKETRAVAIHEAGHAIASHIYGEGTESTRLSIRMRGGSLGHHQAIEKEERFSKFRSEEIAQLIWIMGAIAAEQVFYGENSRGVGGDMQAATSIAGLMAGASAMGPQRIEFEPGTFRSNRDEEMARAKVSKRLRAIGERLMASATVGEFFTPVLNSRDKRPIVAELLGYAYYVAYNTMSQNKDAVEKVANVLVERKEIHGDDVVDLLNGVNLQPAKIDYLEERTWPRL
jgi:cell division protease FtsH